MRSPTVPAREYPVSAAHRSRRWCLRQSALGLLAVAASGLLAACGSAASSPPAANTSTEEAAASVAATTAGSPMATTASATAEATPQPAAATPAGAAGAVPSQGPITLRYAASLTGWKFTDDKGFQTSVHAFAQEHHVNVQEELADATKLLAQYASDTSPDAARLPTSPISYVIKGMVTPLDPFMAKDKTFDINQYYPRLVDGTTYDGKHWSIPEDLQPESPMFYAPATLQSAGVAVPTNDWTWNDLIEQAKHVQQRTGATVQRWGYDARNYYPLGFVYAGGGSLVDDIHHPTTCLLGDPAAISGVQMVVDMMYKYRFFPTPADRTALKLDDGKLFVNDQLGFFTGGTWETTLFLQEPHFQWRMAKTPIGLDGKRTYPTGGSGWGIFSNVKHADLSWALASWITGAKGWKLWLDNRPPQTVWLPAYKPMAEYNVTILKQYVPDIAVVLETADNVTWGPIDPRWADIQSKFIDPKLNDILTGKATAASALPEAAAEATKALQTTPMPTPAK